MGGEQATPIGDLLVDPDARRVPVAGREVAMRAKEFDLLARLMAEPDGDRLVGLLPSVDRRLWDMKAIYGRYVPTLPITVLYKISTADQYPDEGSRQRHQPDGARLIERQGQRLHGRRAGHPQGSRALRDAEGERGLVSAAPDVNSSSARLPACEVAVIDPQMTMPPTGGRLRTR